MPPRKPILIVDDDWDIREAIHDLLVAEGWVTVMASDGESALAWLRANPPPGLILLDWNMAPMNGPQFMARLAREAATAPPVVLLTADLMVEEKLAADSFSGYLKKPVDLDALFDLVGRFCG